MASELPVMAFFPVVRGKVSGVIFEREGMPVEVTDRNLRQVVARHRWPHPAGLIDAHVTLDRKP